MNVVSVVIESEVSGVSREVSDKCYECKWWWEHRDDENECFGEAEACHEFIEVNKRGEPNES